MARKALAFFLLLVAPVAAHAATDASGFEDLDKLEGRLVGALDVDVGKPGGPLTHIDRRLKLKPCPVPATIDPPALMDSSLATRFGSGIGSETVLSTYSRICNSLQPLMFHNSATVDRSSLTTNSSRSWPRRSATT